MALQMQSAPPPPGLGFQRRAPWLKLKVSAENAGTLCTARRPDWMAKRSAWCIGLAFLSEQEGVMALRGFASFLPMAAFAAVFGAALPASAQRGAISGETFTAGTTGALARLCGARAQEPAYAAAIHFCHGVLVGSGQTSDSMHKR